MYGALTGLSKVEIAELVGEERANLWRASLHERPPPLEESHPYSIKGDRQYAELADSGLLPDTESLHDCLQRTMPLWYDNIAPDLRRGFDVLVVAHGNSLRGLVKIMEGDRIDEETVQQVHIPNGIPLVYKFTETDAGELIPTPTPKSSNNSNGLLSGEFLEEKGLLRAALKAEENRRDESGVWNYGEASALTNGPMPAMGLREKALTELEAERKMMKIAMDKVRLGLNPGPSHSGEPSVQSLEGSDVEELDPRFSGPKENKIFSKPNSGYLVIIRHGKTGFNKLGLFTGWEDVPLAPEGHLEAEKAGKLLFKHGFKLDIVFTSWLSRAIETAWHVMDYIGDTWIPVVKTWRLNERMYGDLEGLSKKMTKQRYGDQQFKQWRRGYDTPPPPTSPFSPSYPGNDDRYRKYVTDLPYSFKQSFVRSIANGRLELHRRLPQSESLKDCMARTIPYYTDHIVPEAIEKGKNVMIASSENAIRGLLMHLCDIPSDQISGLEIPTGVPLIFDMKGKCLKLLDDGKEPSPYERYKFGKLKELLFTPQTDAPDVIQDPLIRLDDPRYNWTPETDDADVCDPFVTVDDKIVGFAELPEDCEGPGPSFAERESVSADSVG